MIRFALLASTALLAACAGNDLDVKVSRQVEAAVVDADVVLFVVDAAVGMTDDDEAIAAWLRRAPANPAEHAAPNLAPARPHPGPADRAPEAFRPDPTAVPTKAEYDSLRPATLPVT